MCRHHTAHNTTVHKGLRPPSAPPSLTSRGGAIDLFAGIPVSDYAAALSWYEKLFGSPPTYVVSDTEALWELAEHRSIYIEERSEHAGHAMHTVFVDDFDARVAGIAERGLTPAKQETYSNGVRKTTYLDPEGNEIGFGGTPLRTVTG